MSNNNKKILQLKDENITLLNDCEEMIIKNKKCLIFYGKLTYPMTHCRACHSHKIVKNGTRLSKIKYLKLAELTTFIHLKKQRYICQDCHHCFTAKTPLVNQYCCLSNQVKLAVLLATQTVKSRQMIADDYHVSPSTVHQVIEKNIEYFKHKPLTRLPKNMSIDEFKSTTNARGAMSLIIIDNDTHELVDVLDDRKQDALKKYFMSFPLEERQRVKTISMDMYAPYLVLMPQLFPNAKLIIDKFHIVQAANRELNRERVKIMNNLDKKTTNYKKLKKYYKLLLKPCEDLERKELHSFKHYPYKTTTYDVANDLLKIDTKLETIYDIVHGMRVALKQLNFEAFCQLLDQVKLLKNDKAYEGLYRVCQTFTKLLPHIKNTFDYPHLTNGPIEGMNNKIKVLKRNAYGYHNFSNFRNRIILMFRIPVKYQ